MKQSDAADSSAAQRFGDREQTLASSRLYLNPNSIKATRLVDRASAKSYCGHRECENWSIDYGFRALPLVRAALARFAVGRLDNDAGGERASCPAQ